jgi:hypothetical protein
LKYCHVFHKSIYLDFIYFVWGLECFPWLSDIGVPSECFPVIAWDCWALPNTRHGSKYHLSSCSTNINAFSNIHIWKLKLASKIGHLPSVSKHFFTQLHDGYSLPFRHFPVWPLHYYQVFCVYHFTILLVAHNLVLVYCYCHSY